MTKKIQKMVVLGEANSGKSSLVNFFSNPKEQFSSDYLPTIGANFCSVAEGDISLYCWDMSGDTRFRSLIEAVLKGTDLAIYCVNLSQPLNHIQILNDINLFNVSCPNAAIVLVGTCSDEAIEDSLTGFEELKKETIFLRNSIISIKNRSGTSELQQEIFQLASSRIKPVHQRPLNFDKPLSNAMDKALNLLDSSSPLYKSLHLLQAELERLAIDKSRLIADESYTLIKNLQDPKVVDKIEAINQFEANCKNHLADSHSTYKHIAKIITAVAVTAVVTVIATMIGFGIGFAMGLWTGPGAFISGVLAGATVAGSVVETAVGLGVLSSALTLYGLFKESAQSKAVHAVVVSARENLAGIDLQI